MKTPEQNESIQVLPFGKYKGQPVDVLQSDPEYCEWLISQGWFSERFPQINTLIINNFAKAEDTPVHNSLQARFVEKLFSERFCQALFADVRKSARNTTRFYDQAGAHPGDCEITCHDFEVKGWDVAVGGKLITESVSQLIDGLFCAFIEIKPEVGDDYPSILRQLKTNRMNCGWSDVSSNVTEEDIRKPVDCRFVLVYNQFTASGVTIEQVEKIFKASGFYMLSFNEIECGGFDQLTFS